MEALDMSGVDPMRYAEVRRRIAVVKSFLGLEQADEGDLRRHAEQLGLSSNQFKALVRAWRDLPAARSIAGSGTSRGAQRKGGPRLLQAQVKRAVSEAVTALPPGASLAAACRAVDTACAAAGVQPPSKATIHKMLMKARRGQRSSDDDGALVVARCWVRLPVQRDDQIEMPSLAIALRASDGVIIAATMNEGRLQATALAGLAANIADLARLHIDEALLREAPAGTAGIATIERSASIRRRVARILGDGVDTIRLIYKGGSQRGAERLLRAKKDRPLSHDDAVAVVRTAINVNNARRGGRPAVWID